MIHVLDIRICVVFGCVEENRVIFHPKGSVQSAVSLYSEHWTVVPLWC